MSEAALDAIRNLLRERGPLSTREIAEELTARKQLKSKNPTEYVRNAVAYNRSIIAVGKGKSRKYVYLPAMVRGAAMRLPVSDEPLDGGNVVVSSELMPFLWPGDYLKKDAPARLTLEDGPAFNLKLDRGNLVWPYHYVLIAFPASFWAWWFDKRPPGADSLEIRCEDGEQGRYSARAVSRAEIDPVALRKANDDLIATAAPIATESRAIEWREFGRRVIGSGAFNRDVPPDPLTVALFDPPGRFVLEESRIRFRDDLTPAIIRVLGSRILVPGSKDDWVLRMITSPDEIDLEVEDEPVGGDEEDEDWPENQEANEGTNVAFARRPRPGEQGYRITVNLEWMPQVWRTIEVLESQTLEHVHDAIQHAFNWDDDHLWEFTLSGETHDSVTRIAMPQGFMNPDYDPPTADEVTLGDLELRTGQRLYYLFDFGDSLGHNLRVDGTFVPNPDTRYPAVVETHGEAPRQYPIVDYDIVWVEEEEQAEGQDREL